MFNELIGVSCKKVIAIKTFFKIIITSQFNNHIITLIKSLNCCKEVIKLFLKAINFSDLRFFISSLVEFMNLKINK